MNLPHNPHYLSEADLPQLVEQFEEQGAAEWRLCRSYFDECVVEPGDVIIRQFDSDRVVYVLTDGELEVSVATEPDAAAKPIATVKPVAIIGEQTFLDAQARTATLSAKTQATIHRLTLGAFDKLRTEEPEIACAFLFDVARSLSRRARPLQAKVTDNGV